MPLDFTLGEDDIVARLQTIPGIDVLQGEYLPDSFKPDTDSDGLFVPYVTVKFNGSFPQPNEDGIIGSWYDTQRISITIFIVAPDSRVSRLIRDQVTSALLTPGFQPTDGGPLKPAGSLSFMDIALGYKRYVSQVSFNYLANLSQVAPS